MVAQSLACLLSQGMDPETQCSLYTSVFCGPNQIVVQDLLQTVGVQTIPAWESWESKYPSHIGSFEITQGSSKRGQKRIMA